MSNWSKYLSKVKMAFRFVIPAKDRFRVSFIIVGVQKGGTTALDKFLREHPEVGMGTKKEVHFFDKKEFFKDKPNYSLYHSFFDPKPGQSILGEVSPSYFFIEGSLERIKHYNPEMKILVIFRDPIERAYSHWNMMKQKGKEKLEFGLAIRNEAHRLAKKKYKWMIKYSYVQRGFYSAQLKELRNHFDSDQILLLKSEELKNSPNEALDRVSQFLGISSFQNVKPRSIHSRKYTSKVSEQDIAYLRELYLSDMQEFEKMTGWDLSDWLVMQSPSSSHSH